MPGGQPTKLTDKLITEIVGYISKGNYIEVSCQACGIDQSTYHEYIKLAHELEGKDPAALTEAELRLLEFSKSVKKAHAQAELWIMDQIQTSPQWQRYAWINERTRNERYGQRQQVDMVSKEPIRVIFETVKEGK